MKTLRYFFSAMMLFTLLSSCEKRVFDYRNRYCGTWYFDYSCYSWNVSDGIYGQKSGEHKGEISYDKNNSNKKLLRIEFAPDQISEVEINEEGLLNGCGASGTIKDKNSIYFELSTNACDTDTKSGTIFTITGNKK